MYGELPPAQVDKVKELPENIHAALAQINNDINSVRRHLVFLEGKQDDHEALTAELIQLYRGASIIGKITAWVVGVAGSIGSLLLLFGDKR